MRMEYMVGRRLMILNIMGVPIGWGTYIWNEEILLDTGKKIYTSKCAVEELVNPPPPPPFQALLKKNTRKFFDRGVLVNQGDWLAKGETIWIEKLQRMPWNHGGYLAGQITLTNDEKRWVLISELDLPEEGKPELRVVH